MPKFVSSCAGQSGVAALGSNGPAAAAVPLLMTIKQAAANHTRISFHPNDIKKLDQALQEIQGKPQPEGKPSAKPGENAPPKAKGSGE